MTPAPFDLERGKIREKQLNRGEHHHQRIAASSAPWQCIWQKTADDATLEASDQAEQVTAIASRSSARWQTAPHWQLTRRVRRVKCALISRARVITNGRRPAMTRTTARYRRGWFSGGRSEVLQDKARYIAPAVWMCRGLKAGLTFDYGEGAEMGCLNASLSDIMTTLRTPPPPGRRA